MLRTALVSGLLFMVPACASAEPPAAGAPKADAKKEAASANDVTYQNLKLFGEVFERVRQDYVEEVGDEKMVESALNGMLTSLDPHSSYMTKTELADMQVQTRGEFGGLGIEVTMDKGAVKVISPIDDTPASKAGLQSGDYIVQLDDTPVSGMTLQEAVAKMRGPVGTNIKLLVVREKDGVQAGEPLNITLTRAIIRVQSVRSRVQDNIGYLRVTSFTDKTQEGVDKAIAEIEAKLGDKLQGWVLDLRNNPGGLLEQAISVSDTFIDQGEIVSTRGRTARDGQRYNATPGDQVDGKPVVVLINSGSASASEIVAGALQDHRRAVVMGTKSFGKGSVQTIIPIKDHGAIRLTTARYYTPSGRSIQAEGIVPDIEVQPAKVEALDGATDLPREANLLRALKNDNPNTPTPAPTPAVPEADKKTDAKTEEEKAIAADYQLQRAVDLLHGLWLYDQKAAPAAVKLEAKVEAKTP